MTPELPANTFLLRYFRWSLEEWDRELATDFSRLRAVRTRAADQCLAAFGRMATEKTRPLTIALTKRAHPLALPPAGVELSARERGLLEEFDTHRHLWANANRFSRGLQVSERIPCAQVIRDRLRALGEPEELGRLEWKYSSAIGAVTVETYLDFGGREGDLSYGQRLVAASQSPDPGLISLLAWLGISNTKWRITGESHAEYAALQVELLARHFIEAVPGLTDGL